jgi:hypothetical protein
MEGVAVRVPPPPPPLLPLGEAVDGGVREDSAPPSPAEGVGALEGVESPDPPEEALEVGDSGGEKVELEERVERGMGGEGVALFVPPPPRRGVKEEEEEEEPPTLVGDGDNVPLPDALGEGVKERLVKEEREEEGEWVGEALPPPAMPPPLWEEGEAALVREGDAEEDGEGEMEGEGFAEALPPPPADPADPEGLGVEERKSVETAVAVSPWGGEGVNSVEKVGVRRDVAVGKGVSVGFAGVAVKDTLEEGVESWEGGGGTVGH